MKFNNTNQKQTTRRFVRQSLVTGLCREVFWQLGRVLEAAVDKLK